MPFAKADSLAGSPAHVWAWCVWCGGDGYSPLHTAHWGARVDGRAAPTVRHNTHGDGEVPLAGLVLTGSCCGHGGVECWVVGAQWW